MSLHCSNVGLGDEKLERVENQRCAQPHVTRVPCVELRLKNFGARVSGEAVDTVGADHQVV